MAYYAAYKWAGLSGGFPAGVPALYRNRPGRLSFELSGQPRCEELLCLVTVGGAILAAVSIGARTLLFGWLYLVILLLILEAAGAVAGNGSGWCLRYFASG